MMNWIWWVVGYVVIGWVAGIIHLRCVVLDWEEKIDYRDKNSPVVLIAPAWPLILILYFIEFVFDYIPNKIDDLITNILENKDGKNER
jgi:hypothetical protein